MNNIVEFVRNITAADDNVWSWILDNKYKPACDLSDVHQNVSIWKGGQLDCMFYLLFKMSHDMRSIIHTLKLFIGHVLFLLLLLVSQWHNFNDQRLFTEQFNFKQKHTLHNSAGILIDFNSIEWCSYIQICVKTIFENTRRRDLSITGWASNTAYNDVTASYHLSKNNRNWVPLRHYDIIFHLSCHFDISCGVGSPPKVVEQQ